MTHVIDCSMLFSNACKQCRKREAAAKGDWHWANADHYCRPYHRANRPTYEPNDPRTVNGGSRPGPF